MASDLFKPVLNDRTRSPNFFNGRLLTGEAMSEEQDAQRAVNELLGRAAGDGVAWGLEVAHAVSVSTVARPVVNVKAGTAINRGGEILLLGSDTQVQLVRPAEDVPSPATIFRACTPVTNGTYVADSGVYLLTICSVRAGNGMAPVYGLGDAPSGCNVKDMIDAVEFRLLALPVDDILRDAHLRNAVAYRCFGAGHGADFMTNPFPAASDPRTVLDDMRDAGDLTDCDVPLAILFWTATGGVQFVDMWSVRRRLTRTSPATPFIGVSDTRLASAEAMRDQFFEQVAWIMGSSGLPLSPLRARDHFRWLPPAAYLPLSSSSSAGFGVDTFFVGKTWNRHPNWPVPVYMEGGMLEPLLRESAKYPPIDLEDPEMIWLYHVRQNIRALNDGDAVQPVVVFANANMPFFGEPRLDRAHWNYSNFV
jgi:hypothetical protein